MDWKYHKELIDISEEQNLAVASQQHGNDDSVQPITGFLRVSWRQRQPFMVYCVMCNGVGMLITGSSGIGKSETALELVKRGLSPDCR